MVKREGTGKEETVMKTKQGVFSGGHRASLLRATVKTSKREKQALDIAM